VQGEKRLLRVKALMKRVKGFCVNMEGWEEAGVRGLARGSGEGIA
jgi:hypothetical protein